MSKCVIDSGKLIPVTLSEDEAVAECERLGTDYGESALETLIDDTDEYVEVDGLGLCRVENFKTGDPTEDWCTVTKNADGSYDFRANYYNGGAHWIELVECEMKNPGSQSDFAPKEGEPVFMTYEELSASEPGYEDISNFLHGTKGTDDV